jgi:hypothetical protein
MEIAYINRMIIFVKSRVKAIGRVRLYLNAILSNLTKYLSLDPTQIILIVLKRTKMDRKMIFG